MLRMDSVDDPPTIFIVLTAREHLTRAQCRAPLIACLRSARRRARSVEWFVTAEMQKRGALHLNLLLKGAPAAAYGEIGMAVIGRWCQRVDALPQAQLCEPVWDAEGVATYVAKIGGYITKPSQTPQDGWRGHRTSQTVDYFALGAKATREAYRDSQRARALYALALAEGHDAAAAVERQWELLRAAEHAHWALVDLTNRECARQGAKDSPARDEQLLTDAGDAIGRVFAPLTLAQRAAATAAARARIFGEQLQLPGYGS